MERQVETVLIGGQFKKMMTSHLSGITEKYGLKRVDLEVLYYLSKCGERNTSKDINHYLNMNKGHISQSVERLCRKGYLTALTDQEDRRYIHYHVTERASELSEEMCGVWENMLKKIFEGVSREQLQVFQEVTCKIGENMNRMINE